MWTTITSARFSSACAALLSTVLLSSCATTRRIDSSVLRADAATHGYRKVLVVYMSSQDTARRTVEDTFSSQLIAAGAAGVTTYPAVPDVYALSPMDRTNAVRNTDADAALVIRVADLERTVETSPGLYGPAYGFYDDWQGALGTLHIEPTTYPRDVVVLEARLFDVKKGDVVWTMTTQTVNPSKVQDEIDDYAALVLKQLKKDGMLAVRPH
jgi:hypothetical protein